jgi:hypothetical protein
LVWKITGKEVVMKTLAVYVMDAEPHPAGGFTEIAGMVKDMVETWLSSKGKEEEGGVLRYFREGRVAKLHRDERKSGIGQL